MKNNYFLIISFFVIGCAFKSSEIEQAVNNSSVGIAVVPLATVAVTGDTLNNSLQRTSLVSGISPKLYTKILTKQQLFEIAQANAWKFNEPWKYMGTKDGYHFLALYPFLGLREIYRIKQEDFEIDNVFELTSITAKWRDITIFNYEFTNYPINFFPAEYYKPLTDDYDLMYEYKHLGHEN